MAHGKDKISEVRKLYIFERFSLDKASDFANVSYSTAQRWKKEAKADGDDWDKLRAAHTLAGGDIEELGTQILTDLVVVFKSAMSELKDSPNMDAEKKVKLLASVSDSYIKAMSANQKIMPETSKLAVAFEVLAKFKDYVMQNAPDLAPKFAELLLPFGELMERELK